MSGARRFEDDDYFIDQAELLQWLAEHCEGLSLPLDVLAGNFQPPGATSAPDSLFGTAIQQQQAVGGQTPATAAEPLLPETRPRRETQPGEAAPLPLWMTMGGPMPLEFVAPPSACTFIRSVTSFTSQESGNAAFSCARFTMETIGGVGAAAPASAAAAGAGGAAAAQQLRQGAPGRQEEEEEAEDWMSLGDNERIVEEFESAAETTGYEQAGDVGSVSRAMTRRTVLTVSDDDHKLQQLIASVFDGFDLKATNVRLQRQLGLA